MQPPEQCAPVRQRAGAITENKMNKILLATALFGALLISSCVVEPYRGHEYRDGYQYSRGDSYPNGYQYNREANRNFEIDRDEAYHGYRR
jgi:hypothetical protein